MQNFSESVCSASVVDGELALPVGDVPEPFVDADDVADAMVAALTEEGHARRTYEVTGPRLLTFAEAVAEIAGRAAATSATPPSRPRTTRRAGRRGRAGRLADLLMYLFTQVLDGRNARLTDGVERALGRPPRDFAAFAAAAASTGAWDVTAAGAR